MRTPTRSVVGLLAALAITLASPGCRRDRPVPATDGWHVADRSSSWREMRPGTLHLWRESANTVEGERGDGRPFRYRARLKVHPTREDRVVLECWPQPPVEAARTVLLSLDGAPPRPLKAEPDSRSLEFHGQSLARMLRNHRGAVFLLPSREPKRPVRIRFALDGLDASLRALDAEADARARSNPFR